jgi:hypothetical protein
VTDIQNYCAGGTFGPDGVTGCAAVTSALVTLDGIQQTDSASFAGVSLLSITDDFTLDGGLGGSASGGSFTDQFTAVGFGSTGTFWIFTDGLGAGPCSCFESVAEERDI